MTEVELTPPSYLKYALGDQHNLVLLFGAVCFSAAFASPLPVVAGAGAELLWLLVGPRLPAFRTWVDARLSAQYLARAEVAIQGALGELSQEEATRFTVLSEAALELTAAGYARASMPAREIQLAQHSLLELRRTFLDYQFLGQRVVALIDATPTAEVEQEAARLQAEYSAERELMVRMTIRKALTLAQARLQQQVDLHAIWRTLCLRLEMLEKTLPQVKLRLADPEFSRLSQELEKALAEIGPAETLELAVDQTFDAGSVSKPALGSGSLPAKD
jgi:hypothetical protein